MLSSDEMWWPRWGLGKLILLEPCSYKWPFPGHVGFGLNASPRQIHLTKWRVRALWVCHSDIIGSVCCHVELQLLVNFRQSCEDLRSQGLTHDLSAPLGLQNPSTGAVLPSSVVFLACLTSSLLLGMCWLLMSVTVFHSMVFPDLLLVPCFVVEGRGNSVPSEQNSGFCSQKNRSVLMQVIHSSTADLKQVSSGFSPSASLSVRLSCFV